MAASLGMSKIYGDGDTVDAARRALADQVRSGRQIILEEIVSAGGDERQSAYGATLEEATLEAKKKVPAGAQELRTSDERLPSTRTVRVQSFGEDEARSEVLKTIKAGDEIESSRLVGEGRKGFLGVGRSPSDYEVAIRRNAKVEVTYRPLAKVEATVVERQGEDAAGRVAALITDTSWWTFPGFPGMSQLDFVLLCTPPAHAYDEIWTEILEASFTSVFYRIMDDALGGLQKPRMEDPAVRTLYMAAFNNAVVETLAGVLGTAAPNGLVKMILLLNLPNWQLDFGAASCLNGVSRQYTLRCVDIKRKTTAENLCEVINIEMTGKGRL
jgi:hypothetical protein